MNAARAMGNSLDDSYIPELIKAFDSNNDERVQRMIAWALGRIGGSKAKSSLERFRKSATATVKEEIEIALDR